MDTWTDARRNGRIGRRSLVEIFIARDASHPLHGRWYDVEDLEIDSDGEVVEVLKGSYSRISGRYFADYTDGIDGWDVLRLVLSARDDYDIDPGVVVAYVALFGAPDSPEKIEEAYRGEWGCKIEFAQDWAASTDRFKDIPSRYIDWEAYAADLRETFAEHNGLWFWAV